jgi:hypothetical protein
MHPYHAANGTCDTVKAKQSPVLVHIDDHQDVLANSEEGLAKAAVAGEGGRYQRAQESHRGGGGLL